MMRKIGVILFTVTWAVALFAAGYLYDHHAVGILIMGELSIVGLVLMSQIDKETAEPERDSCEGCKHDLGGGRCRMNVELECREGGGFEMWEDDDDV